MKKFVTVEEKSRDKFNKVSYISGIFKGIEKGMVGVHWQINLIFAFRQVNEKCLIDHCKNLTVFFVFKKHNM
jgi:hypothetical protein